MADTFERAPGTPEDVDVTPEPREPQVDPRVGVPRLENPPQDPTEAAPHRLVVIGDSLSHGFQSGAIYNTDISYPAIIASELGWFDSYRYPVYGGPGGLPINIEYLLRDLEDRYGTDISLWETPFAVVRARHLMDQIEDYWERGPGSRPTRMSRGINHDLSVYGWDLRDALARTAGTCRAALQDAEDPHQADRREQRRPGRAERLPRRRRRRGQPDPVQRRGGPRQRPAARGSRLRDRDTGRLSRRQQRVANGHQALREVERRRLRRAQQQHCQPEDPWFGD